MAQHTPSSRTAVPAAQSRMDCILVAVIPQGHSLPASPFPAWSPLSVQRAAWVRAEAVSPADRVAIPVHSSLPSTSSKKEDVFVSQHLHSFFLGDSQPQNLQSLSRKQNACQTLVIPSDASIALS